jgi:hypothetical protein
MRDIFVPPWNCCCLIVILRSFSGVEGPDNQQENRITPETRGGRVAISPIRDNNSGRIPPGLPGSGGANAEMIALTV